MQQLIIITGNDEEGINKVCDTLNLDSKKCMNSLSQLKSKNALIVFPFYEKESFENIFRFPQNFQPQKAIFCSKGEQLAQILQFVQRNKCDTIVKIFDQTKTGSQNRYRQIKNNQSSNFQQNKQLEKQMYEKELENWFKIPISKQIKNDSSQIKENLNTLQNKIVNYDKSCKNGQKIIVTEKQLLNEIRFTDPLSQFQFLFYLQKLIQTYSEQILQIFMTYSKYCPRCSLLINTSSQGNALAFNEQPKYFYQQQFCKCGQQNAPKINVRSEQRKFQTKKATVQSGVADNKDFLKTIENKIIAEYQNQFISINKVQTENFIQQQNYVKEENKLSKQKSQIYSIDQLNILLVSVEDEEKNNLFSRLNSCQQIKNKYFEKSNGHKKFNFYNTPVFSMEEQEDEFVEQFRQFFQRQSIDFLFVCVKFERTDIMKSRINQIVKKFVGVSRQQIGIIVLNWSKEYKNMEENVVENLIRQFKCVLFDDMLEKENSIIFQIERVLLNQKKQQIDISNTEFAAETENDRLQAKNIENQLNEFKLSIKNKNLFQIKTSNYDARQLHSRFQMKL